MESSKSNAEIAREIVAQWQDLFEFPPVDDHDKARMGNNIAAALATAQSNLAEKVLVEIRESRSVGEVEGRLRDLFTKIGIEIGGE